MVYFPDKIARFEPSSKQFFKKAKEYKQTPNAQTSVLKVNHEMHVSLALHLTLDFTIRFLNSTYA
jgi:hypothetical protein